MILHSNSDKLLEAERELTWEQKLLEFLIFWVSHIPHKDSLQEENTQSSHG